MNDCWVMRVSEREANLALYRFVPWPRTTASCMHENHEQVYIRFGLIHLRAESFWEVYTYIVKYENAVSSVQRRQQYFVIWERQNARYWAKFTINIRGFATEKMRSHIFTFV